MAIRHALTLLSVDLEPDETEDIDRIVEKAKQLGAYLHIEIKQKE